MTLRYPVSTWPKPLSLVGEWPCVTRLTRDPVNAWPLTHAPSGRYLWPGREGETGRPLDHAWPVPFVHSQRMHFKNKRTYLKRDIIRSDWLPPSCDHSVLLRRYLCRSVLLRPSIEMDVFLKPPGFFRRVLWHKASLPSTIKVNESESVRAYMPSWFTWPTRTNQRPVISSESDWDVARDVGFGVWAGKIQSSDWLRPSSPSLIGYDPSRDPKKKSPRKHTLFALDRALSFEFFRARCPFGKKKSKKTILTTLWKKIMYLPNFS